MNLGTIHNLFTSVRGQISSLDDEVNGIVSDKSDDLLQLDKDRILLGRDNEGKTFTPTYTNDPYFKTSTAADAYAKMKDRLLRSHNARIWHILPYPNKDRDTPNLIVKGNFQDAMFIRVSGDSYEIGSTYEEAGDINAKYNGKVFGTSPEAKTYFYRYMMHERLFYHLWKPLIK